MGESAAIARGNRPPSSHARYVGRVGGLAFALGIGAAVLAGAGAASANTGDSGAGGSGAGGSGATTSQSSPGPRTQDHRPKTVRAKTSSANDESTPQSRRQARRDVVSERRAARQAARVTSAAPRRSATPVTPVTIETTSVAYSNPAVRTPNPSLGTAKPTETVTAAASPAADRTVVADGLNGPVDFQFLPDGRIVVAEKGGKIRIVEDGVVSRRPLVRLPVLTQGERGINGIAVDPDFATNGYLYVAYTTRFARDRLTRLTVVGNRVAFLSPKTLLQTTDRSALFHRGGALGFGPDGTLYWGVGDNKNGANAQDLSTIHGKIVRINPDGTVPTDNPDLGPGALPVIYASGLRNPFRLTFTPTGQLLVADVGENSFEELNLVTAGGNYGWPDAEGNCAPCASIDPIYTYAHGTGGAAITSVLFYDGGRLGADYQNKVFIADEVKGWMKALTCSADFSSCGDVQDFDPAAGRSVVLRQAPDGSIYQLTYAPGQLVRIAAVSRSPDSPDPWSTSHPIAPLLANAPRLAGMPRASDHRSIWSRAARVAAETRSAVQHRWAAALARAPRPVQQTWRLLERTGRETLDDRVPGLAAEAALFSLISLPALLIAVLGSLGFIAQSLGPDGTAELRRLVLDVPETFLSERTYASYSHVATSVLAQGRGSVVSLGILLSLWTGSSAVNRYLQTIAIAYDLEPRPVWRGRLLALGLTIGGLLGAVAVLPPLVVGPRIVRGLAPDAVADATLQTLNSLFWPGIILVVVAGVATVYHVGVPWRTPWRRDLPGAVLAMALWLAASAGLRSYVERSLQDGLVYSQLAVPIAVVLWLYLTSFSVLLGAEFNAEIERMWPHEDHPWRLRLPSLRRPADHAPEHAGDEAAAAPSPSGSGQAR